MTNRSRGWMRTTASAFAVLVLATLTLVACTASDPDASDTPSSSARPTPTSTSTAPGTIEPTPTALDDGTYRAAVYAPAEGTVVGEADLEAGTLVDLGGGCLGLEDDDGDRTLVAFPLGTTLENGRVSVVGMGPFGLDQPLRYSGAMGSTADGAFSLALPSGCPPEITDIWYFVVPSSAGVGSPGDD